MKSKLVYQYLLLIVFCSLLTGVFVSAQNLYKRNRGDNQTCRSLTQTLYMGKTASGAKQQDWLVYEVGRLQKLLDKLGYFGPKPDYGSRYDVGYFDRATYNAVKKYQRENLPWISSDGRVGGETLNFINKYELCNSDRRFARLDFNKVYNSSDNKLSFKYPGSDFVYSPEISEKDNSKLRSYLDICNIDEYTSVDLQKKTLCYKQSRSGSFVGASIFVDILKDKNTKDTCLIPDKNAKKQNQDLSQKVKINGLEFLNFVVVKKDVGHELTSDTYRIFKSGNCYEFKLNTELSRIGTFTTEEVGLSETLDQAIGKMRASLETVTFGK